MPVKGVYLAMAGGAAILTYSGLKGYSPANALRSVLGGKNIQTTAVTYPIDTASAAFSTPAGGVSGLVTGAVAAHQNTGPLGQEIAQDAQKYEGAGYVWGGAPGNGQGNWDCSSFSNAVIGRDMGLAIPTYKAGAYHGQSHGPTTVVWLVWPGCFTIKRKDAGPGDLAIWQTHMGIIIDGGEHMISALDPADGTRTTTIKGGAPAGEILSVRRLKAVTPKGGHSHG